MVQWTIDTSDNYAHGDGGIACLMTRWRSCSGSKALASRGILVVTPGHPSPVGRADGASTSDWAVVLHLAQVRYSLDTTQLAQG